jgi:Protein of unknown function (DUF1501)
VLRRSATTPFFRRDLIFGTLNGFGALALHQLMSSETTRASESSGMLSGLLPKRKAKNCIFLFMAGGVSQMDSFEYKPVLNALHGKPIPRVPPITIGELQGKLSFPHVCVGSPFRFQQYGASGRYISELLPNLAKHVDDLAFIHGIEVDNQNHGPATLLSIQAALFRAVHPLVRGFNMALAVSTRICPAMS